MIVKVYADVLFAISSLMVFTAYGGVSLIYNLHTKISRLILGSFALSLISVFIMLGRRTAVNPLSLLLLAALGSYLCLGVKAPKKNLLCSLTSLVIGLLTGGARTAAANLLPQGDSALGIILISAGVYLCLLYTAKRLRTITVKKQQLYRLTVCRDNISAELTALADTGNELTGGGSESVIIAERQAVNKLFENPGTALRLLPFKGINGSGALIGVICDCAYIDGVKTERVIVAASDMLSGKGYNALIGAALVPNTGRIV